MCSSFRCNVSEFYRRIWREGGLIYSRLNDLSATGPLSVRRVILPLAQRLTKSMKQHGLNGINNYKNNSGYDAEKDWPSKKLRKRGANFLCIGKPHGAAEP
jgi:hypothetical protein